MIFRLLILLLVIGLGAVGWWYYTADPQTETFETVLLQLDTAQVDAIELQLPREADKLLLRRVRDHWIGNLGTVSFQVRAEAIDSLLQPAVLLESSGLQTEGNWTASPIAVRYMTEGETSTSFLVGGMPDGPEGRTEFGFPDRADQYLVPFNLRAFFDRKYSEYRDDGFLQLDTAQIRAVGISLAPDQVWSWVKEGETWAGPELLREWLAGLQLLKGIHFDDGFDPIAKSELLVCSIEFVMADDTPPVAVYIYEDTSAVRPFILNSSQYPQHFFRSDSAGIFREVFPEGLIPE